MEENESVVILGCERFANYTGYSSTFKFSGAHADPTPVDPVLNRLQTVLVAVDAVSFRNKLLQYKRELILREILKAYAGFSIEDSVLGVRSGAAARAKEQAALSEGAITDYLMAPADEATSASDALAQQPYTFQTISTGNWVRSCIAQIRADFAHWEGVCLTPAFLVLLCSRSGLRRVRC
jgi:hypothetical protein